MKGMRKKALEGLGECNIALGGSPVVGMNKLLKSWQEFEEMQKRLAAQMTETKERLRVGPLSPRPKKRIARRFDKNDYKDTKMNGFIVSPMNSPKVSPLCNAAPSSGGSAHPKQQEEDDGSELSFAISDM